MFALFLTALLLVAAVAVAGVLADSGLRWWSAFGRLHHEMKGDAAPVLPNLRPAPASLSAYSVCERPAATRLATRRISRAA